VNPVLVRGWGVVEVALADDRGAKARAADSVGGMAGIPIRDELALNMELQ